VRTPDEIEKDIISHPERDDLRREFANAIAARDPQWGQFIIACLNPNSGGAPFFQPDDDLESRLKAPFRRFGDVGVTFHRGFPTTAYVPIETFLEHGDEILSLAPIFEVIVKPPLDDDGYRPHWNDYLPALVNCPALARVRELVLGTGWFDFASMKQVIMSPFIESLLRFTPGDWRFDSLAAYEQQKAEMWSLLLDSPVFRRMISWGLNLGNLGDRMTKEPYQHYDETIRYTWRYEPMNQESRALEQKYGYIPCLHAGNWDASVLDVLRGIKPDYPVGAKPTEEMYAVPPQKDSIW
jgi:hypothetical protein